jgi:hypothetical protein
MALLTRQSASDLTGATITFSAATVTTGDTLVGGQSVHLLVNNASGSPITLTLTTPETVEGSLAVADRAITVTNGTIREIPVPSRYNDPTTGLATFICSAVTSVTVAAVQGSATP